MPKLRPGQEAQAKLVAAKVLEGLKKSITEEMPDILFNLPTGDKCRVSVEKQDDGYHIRYRTTEAGGRQVADVTATTAHATTAGVRVAWFNIVGGLFEGIAQSAVALGRNIPITWDRVQ